MSSREIRSTFLLILAALVWGVAFVAQSVGADHVGAFTFLSLRTYLGVAVLLPVIQVMDRLRVKAGHSVPARADRKTLIKGGLICGFFLFAASAAQQIGIAYTTAGKSGFVTAMYVVLVPVLSVMTGRRPGARIWAAVVMSVLGLYLLCIKGGMTVNIGDLWTLLAAFLFSIQIMAVGHFAGMIDGVRLTCVEFAFEALFATVCMLIFERGTPVSSIVSALPAILYAGIFSSGVGYTLQTLGERDVNPAVASLAMCLESVFSALFGWIILKEVLSQREFIGCAMMLCAVLVAELPVEALPWVKKRRET